MAIYLSFLAVIITLAFVLIFKGTKKEFNQDLFDNNDDDEFNQ